MNVRAQLFLFIALMMSANASLGREQWGMTDSEVASMPPLCKGRMSGGAEYKRWESILGPDFAHTHHYCMGINFLNRAYKVSNTRERGFYLQEAHNNLMYMVKAASPTYSLMPDVYLNLGNVFKLRGDIGKAAANYSKAIELNPRQPSAYRNLTNFYATTGQRMKALEVVTDGLRHNPGTKSLQRYYRELGGELPYPEPAATTATIEGGAPPAHADVNANQVLPSESQLTPPETPPQSAGEDYRKPIGSPTNPYCRFCPPE
jgi:tetratricopeptide (TPR) repeat protein